MALRLRKGKKILATYKSSADFAEDKATLEKYFAPVVIPKIQDAMMKNLFGFAIRGAKMNLGNGFVFENVEVK